MYSHIPKSGLENGNPSVKDFYMADELKYHGKKNRGAFLLNFGGKTKKSPTSTDLIYIRRDKKPAGSSPPCLNKISWH